MTWREDKRTDKQIDAIVNMKSALGWTCNIPETKGECCDLIAKMKTEASNRFSGTGSMCYNAEIDAHDDFSYRGDLEF